MKFNILANLLGQYRLVWSMYQNGQCFGEVDVQVGLMFEVPQGMSLIIKFSQHLIEEGN